MELDETGFRLVVGIQKDRRSSSWTRTQSSDGRLCFVLVQLEQTSLITLPNLPIGVVPIEPVEKGFTISEKRPRGKTISTTVKRRQLPITAAYAFTDYRAQGQTISPVIVDISNPPRAELSLRNIYVALSRSRGRDFVRILRDFDEKNLYKPHQEKSLYVIGTNGYNLDPLDRIIRLCD